MTKSSHTIFEVIFLKFYIDKTTKEIFLSCKEIKNPELSILDIEYDDTKHEKHLPKVEIKNNHVSVKIGDIMHPMTQEHYITFIFLETDAGGQFKYLTYADSPEADFILNDNETAIAVYEYCTLHGLWKTVIKK